MTVNSTTNRVSYTGNGTANPLAVAFPFQAKADLLVIETITATGTQITKTLTTDYTITGTPDANGFYPNGGSVVPVSSIPATKRWTIIRDPAITQTTQHTDNDPLPAASITNPLDKGTMIAQRLKDRIDRAIRAPDGDPSGLSYQLLNAVARAGHIQEYNSDGSLRSDRGFSDMVGDAVTQLLPTIQAIGSNVIPIDVFLIIGQSNAQGSCPAGQESKRVTPVSGKVLRYYSAAISNAADPVSGASGSAWPVFGNSIYYATGRPVCFVPAAVGSTAQAAAADTGDGNWDIGGTLVAASFTLLDAALVELIADGYAPRVAGFLLCQGETDGLAINAATITQADYVNALTSMISRYWDRYGATIPFCIFRTGKIGGYSDTGPATVRASQDYVETILREAGKPAFVVFRNAVDFTDRGLHSGSNVHYDQDGYNEMGAVGAANFLAATSQHGWQLADRGDTTARGIYYNDGPATIGGNKNYSGVNLAVLGGAIVGAGGTANPASGCPISTIMGYNTVSNYGFVQSSEPGVAAHALVLNPLGGNVGIGAVTTPDALLHVGGSIYSGKVGTNGNFRLYGDVATGTGVFGGAYMDASYVGRLNLFAGSGTGAVVNQVAIAADTIPASDATSNFGLDSNRWKEGHFSSFVRTSPKAVASLVAAATAGSGARDFVTDANATTFNSVVAGGGSNKVPVFCDGTDWKIG